MSWFGENVDHSKEASAFQRVNQHQPHEGELSHELIAAAASYEGMRKYEEHCREKGQPQSHAQAREIFAGFAGAFIDKIVETKSLDYIDKSKLKTTLNPNERQTQMYNDY